MDSRPAPTAPPRADAAGARCDSWVNDRRCHRDASVRLYAPDGKRCPSGPICRQCAEEIVSEYREKLDQVWSFEAVS